MRTFKLLSAKKIIIISILITILLMFKDYFIEFIKSATVVEDLAHLSKEEYDDIRKHMLSNLLSIGVFKFQLSFYLSFFIPILIIILGFDYNKIKNNYIKYNIGKNDRYLKEKRKLKLKLSILAGVITSLIFIFFSFIGLMFGEGSMELLYNRNDFDKNSILNTIFGSEIGMFIFVLLTWCVGSIVNAWLAFTLIDHAGYIKGALIFLGIIWVGAIILYQILPYYLVPMTTLMTTAYQKINIIKTLAPYTLIVLILVYLNYFKKYEVE